MLHLFRPQIVTTFSVNTLTDWFDSIYQICPDIKITAQSRVIMVKNQQNYTKQNILTKQRINMSIFTNLLSLRAVEQQSFEAKTPKPEQQYLKPLINQVLLVVENVTKPHPLSCDISEHISSKAVYNLNISQPNNQGNVVIQQSMRGKKSQPFSFTLQQTINDKDRSPIQKLYSAAKRQSIPQRNSITNRPSTILPLYSNSCQMLIKIYLIENYESKAKLIPNIDRIHSDEQFRLKREQIYSWITQLNAKQKQLLAKPRQSIKKQPQIMMASDSNILRNSQNIQDLSVWHQLQNKMNILLRRLPSTYQQSSTNTNPQQSRLLMNKQKFKQYSQKYYDNYLCTLNKNILVNDTEYNLQIEFLLSVQKLKQCSGYMRAACNNINQLNGRDSFIQFDHDLQSRKINQVSQVRKIGDVTKSNLAYILDFSGTRESQGRFQSASRTERESMKRSVKNQIRSHKQQKQTGIGIMKLFQCCTSAQQVDESQEVKQFVHQQKQQQQHKSNNSNSILRARSEAIQRKKKPNIKNAQKKFYAGTCQNRNLFSVLDQPRGVHQFTWFQQKY